MCSANGLQRSPHGDGQGASMTWTVPLRGIIPHATESPTIEVGQQWIAIDTDEVAAITIIRAVDEQQDAWFVHRSTGQPHTLTTKQIATGYRLVC